MSLATSLDVRDPATIRRLLPALRRMVRFPDKKLTTISTELNVELADLYAWVKSKGRPTEASIEQLEDQLAGMESVRSEAMGGEPRDSKNAIDGRRAREGRAGTLLQSARPQAHLPPNISGRAPAGTQRIAPPKSAAAADDTGLGNRGVAETNPPADGNPPSSLVEPWTQMVSVRRAIVAAWIPALRALVGGMAPKEASVSVGKTQGAFWQFRNSYFGPGKITPERFEAFLAWCRELGIEGAEASAPAADAPPGKSIGELMAPGSRVAGETGEELPASSERTDASAHVVACAGDIFRVEIVVRLVPLTPGGGS
jgi:hypothetical protein